MKKILIVAIILFSVFISNAQTRLCYDVYYYKNPKHTQKTYKNILIITNASFKSLKALKKAARQNDYKITISSELFPPIKSYTDREIAKGIKDNHIDAILYYTIKGTSEISSYSYGTYTMPSSVGIGSFESSKHSTYFTTVEAALVEPGSKDEKEFYCSGGAKGNSFDVTYRVFNKILKKFEKIGIASPPASSDDNSPVVSNTSQLENDFGKYESAGNENLEKQNYQLALENFNKAIELDSNNALGYFGRSRAKSELGDENGAIADCNKTIELKPAFSMAYNNRAWSSFKLKNNIDALKDLNKAIELDGKNYTAYDSRQEVRFILNDFVGCMEDCNVAISLNPKLANSYLFRGKVYLKNGDKTKACENWSKAGEYGAMEAYDYIKTNCN